MKNLIEGIVVHYVSKDFPERPAIIVCIMDKEKGIVSLQVFGDAPHNIMVGERDLTWRVQVPYSEEKVIHSWHWIERE